MSHEYEVGTYIDLRHLNSTKQEPQKPSMTTQQFADYVQREAPIGTRYTFRMVAGQLVSAVQIPVVFA